MLQCDPHEKGPPARTSKRHPEPTPHPRTLYSTMSRTSSHLTAKEGAERLGLSETAVGTWLRAYERVTGKKLPRGRRGAWQIPEPVADVLADARARMIADEALSRDDAIAAAVAARPAPAPANVAPPAPEPTPSATVPADGAGDSPPDPPAEVPARVDVEALLREHDEALRHSTREILEETLKRVDVQQSELNRYVQSAVGTLERSDHELRFATEALRGVAGAVDEAGKRVAGAKVALERTNRSVRASIAERLLHSGLGMLAGVGLAVAVPRLALQQGLLLDAVVLVMAAAAVLLVLLIAPSLTR